MRPRRVVHVLGGAGVGGTERQLLLLLGTFDPARVESDVILIRGGPLEREFHQRGPTEVIAKRGKIDPVFFARLVRGLRRRRPDIVHTWGSTATLWGVPAARLARARGVVAAERAVDEWQGRLLPLMARIVYGLADRVVGNSQAVVEAAKRRGAHSGKVAVVANGVATPSNSVRQPHPGLVVLLGRLDPRKGHDVLIEATPTVEAAIPGLSVVFAGDAVRDAEVAFAARVQARARELGIDRLIDWRGLVDDPLALLDQASLVVIPSRHEGQPNVMLEAMAHGVPVVAAASGGIPEILVDGVNGWLVPPADAAALAAAMIDALSRPEEATRRAEAARRDVRRRFSDTVSAGAWADIYDELVHRKQCASSM